MCPPEVGWRIYQSSFYCDAGFSDKLYHWYWWNWSSSTCIVNGNNLTATGGLGASYSTATNGQCGIGGAWSIIGVSNYIGSIGSPGESQQRSFSQFDATHSMKGAKLPGVDGANLINTGGLGQYYLYNNTGATLIYRNGNLSSGLEPGGAGPVVFNTLY